jgi:hypothetical protein
MPSRLTTYIDDIPADTLDDDDPGELTEADYKELRSLPVLSDWTRTLVASASVAETVPKEPKGTTERKARPNQFDPLADEIRTRLAAGESVATIAAAIGRNQFTLNNFITQRHLRGEYVRSSPAQDLLLARIDEIRERAQRGESRKAIQEAVGTSMPSLNIFLATYQIRTHGTTHPQDDGPS